MLLVPYEACTRHMTCANGNSYAAGDTLCRRAHIVRSTRGGTEVGRPGAHRRDPGDQREQSDSRFPASTRVSVAASLGNASGRGGDHTQERHREEEHANAQNRQDHAAELEHDGHPE
jgi:hypothetical protein